MAITTRRRSSCSAQKKALGDPWRMAHSACAALTYQGGCGFDHGGPLGHFGRCGGGTTSTRGFRRMERRPAGPARLPPLHVPLTDAVLYCGASRLCSLSVN